VEIKSNMTEGKLLIYTVLAIFLLMAIHLFQRQLNAIYAATNYVGFHTLLEFLSISISATIFFYGLKSYGVTRSSRMLLLSLTFFLVGMLDLLHTISFKGMPYFITESSVAKATWFWIIARIFNSLLMLSILLIPDRRLKRDYRASTQIIAIFIAASIGFLVINFEKSLPLLFIEGQGTTSLKNGIEYIICFILFFGLIATLYQYHIEKSFAKLAIALAFVFLLLTELIFTIYQSVDDLNNFSGHIFKVFGFYFLLKGFYFSNEESEQQEKEENQKLISELPGFIFKVVKRGDDFIGIYWEGELLKRIGLDREDIVGKSLSRVFPMMIKEYCRLSWKLQETIAFEMAYMGKSLLISIKPWFEEDEKKVIIGTVIDMTGVHDEPTLKQLNMKIERTSK
jgi:hypothetical protein